MKNRILSCLLIIYTNVTTTFSQIKPPLDTSAFRNWMSIGSSTISNDGNYVIYSIDNTPINLETLILVSTNGKWKRDIPGGANLTSIITEDSKFAVFKKPQDSLGIMELGKDQIEYFSNIESFKTPKKGSGEWLALKTTTNELILKNLHTRKKEIFKSVVDYFFDDNGKFFLVKTDNLKNNPNSQSLHWLNLSNGHLAKIWEGNNASNFIFNQNGSQLAFKSEIKLQDNTYETILWQYREGRSEAISLINDKTKVLIENELLLDDIISFSYDDSILYINVKEKEIQKRNQDFAQLNIWSYADRDLQPKQLSDLSPVRYKSAISLQNSAVNIIESKKTKLIALNPVLLDYAILVDSDDDGRFSDSKSSARYYLFSFKHQTKVYLNDGGEEFKSNNCVFSPNGRFIVFFNTRKLDFVTYDILAQEFKEITHGIEAQWMGNDENDADFLRADLRGMAGWISNEKILIYDQYDLWEFDLLGRAKAFNLTNGYGKKNKIVFNLAINDHFKGLIPLKKELILIGFNKVNKLNGFFSVKNGESKNPEQLSLDPFVYWNPMGSIDVEKGAPPLKARDRNVYLLQRMSATKSPNYFTTKDFKIFKQISDLNPEEKYNWLTTELHTWNTSDGKKLQGILYKPENFDPNKKYPLIFYYYRKLSDNLNSFIKPGFSNGKLNIPWYVSNGYLVFTPDIHFTMQETGESAMSAIVSAANHLSKFSYVNKRKMGLQGISFGSFETNYIITHTKMFAAACSSSGLYNLISAYNSVNSGVSKHDQFEMGGPYQIGASLWENPTLYIKNSPIFYADKVCTPLLMMHTTYDGTVPLANAIEFYSALRRLGKKVWMLQYDNCNHALWGKEAEDFTLRMQQFFDHYLKDLSSPKWMTEGRPARLKGVSENFDLEYPGTVHD